MSGRPVTTRARLIIGGVGVATVALGAIALAEPVGADQVGSLSTQAKTISQELVQEQLQAGAYQQQYSVASAQVAADERAMAPTQSQINDDRAAIGQKRHRVQRLAIASYVLNGSVSATSGASLFSENVKTVQSANEYVTITVGNIGKALAELHTAQQNEQNQEALLEKQGAHDRSEQAQQASYLSHANTTLNQLQSVQAQVTGQLATAVANQAASQQRTAAAAVANAQKTAALHQGSTTSSAPSTSTVVAPTDTTTTDPALNPFLACVAQAESGDNYGAVSPDGLYRGAFQFSQSTWNLAAQAAGRPDLIGVPPNLASKADQDTVAVALFALDGERPWLGDRCSA